MGKPVATPAVVLELYPAKLLPTAAHGRSRSKKVFTIGTPHGRSRHKGKLSVEARKDPWRHKDQASGQG